MSRNAPRGEPSRSPDPSRPPTDEPLDRRIRRTRDRLGDALIELVQEKPFDAITVQEVLDRADVGRTTFYAHFSDKEDLLWSDVDEFLERFSRLLLTSSDPGRRVAPVRELFTHVADQERLWSAFVQADKLHAFLDLAQVHFARAIEERLATRPAPSTPSPQPPTSSSDLPFRSAALAGALLALLRTWRRTHPLPDPARMDALFHTLCP